MAPSRPPIDAEEIAFVCGPSHPNNLVRPHIDPVDETDSLHSIRSLGWRWGARHLKS
jgi:hypothetical protein